MFANPMEELVSFVGSTVLVRASLASLVYTLFDGVGVIRHDLCPRNFLLVIAIHCHQIQKG
jgi:hypothetical protein